MPSCLFFALLPARHPAQGRGDFFCRLLDGGVRPFPHACALPHHGCDAVKARPDPLTLPAMSGFSPARFPGKTQQKRPGTVPGLSFGCIKGVPWLCREKGEGGGRREEKRFRFLHWGEAGGYTDGQKDRRSKKGIPPVYEGRASDARDGSFRAFWAAGRHQAPGFAAGLDCPRRRKRSCARESIPLGHRPNERETRARPSDREAGALPSQPHSSSLSPPHPPGVRSAFHPEGSLSPPAGEKITASRLRRR